MSDFKFNCPHCNQSLEAPEDLLGQTIECPSCNGSIQIPAPEQQPAPTPDPPSVPKKKIVNNRSKQSGNTKPCPSCGEHILHSAQKCKHCGEFLKGQHEVETNVKQGALIGAVVCFAIGIILMFISLWSFIIYSPLFLAAFILSIVAMSQKRVAGGLITLLLTLIVPPVLFLGLGAARGKTAVDEISKALDEASADIDRSIGVSAPGSGPTVPAELPGWKLRTDTSPIDDSKSYYLSRDAEEPIGSGFLSSTPTLMIRHKEGELQVYITFGKYLGSGTTTVTARMDSSPAVQNEWGLSTDGKAVFCPTDAAGFVMQLLEHEKLVIRLTPFGESPVTTTFDLTRLSEAIQPMRQLLEASVSEPAGWHLRTDTSPIDDSKTYMLMREADEPVGSGFKKHTPSLIIRHREGDLEVYITFGSYLGSETTIVTVRLGNLPPLESKWWLSTDGKAIFCPTDNAAFVRQLLEHEKLVIRLTPFGESPVTATFDLTRLSEAIQPMRHLIR